MSAQASEKQLLERLRELLLMLPYDLKALLEALSDADLAMPARELAAGGIIYCLTPHDSIPDTQHLYGFVDDAILMRVVFQKILELAGDEGPGYRERFPDQFDRALTDVDLFRSYFGDTMAWVDTRIGRFKDTKYKGKRIYDYPLTEDSTVRLYEDANDFTTAYEIDDRSVERLTNGKIIMDMFKKRCEADQTRRA